MLQQYLTYHDSPLAGHYGVARTQALVGLITPCFKEFYRTNTLSHQCPYTEHAHFNQIEYAMNLLV